MYIDALCSNRVYKEAWTEEDVLHKIKEDRGKHFDPEVVDSFLISMTRSKRFPALSGSIWFHAATQRLLTENTQKKFFETVIP